MMTAKNKKFGGDIVPCCAGHQKLAYIISVFYGDKEYVFSPTLFSQDGPKWVCVPNSPYDCVAEPNDYPKKLSSTATNTPQPMTTSTFEVTRSPTVKPSTTSEPIQNIKDYFKINPIPGCG